MQGEIEWFQKIIGIISKMVVFETRLLPNSLMSRSLPEAIMIIMMMMIIIDGVGDGNDDDDMTMVVVVVIMNK